MLNMGHINHNRWRLGGKLVERRYEPADDGGLARIMTLERGDSSRYEFELDDEVADLARNIQRGDFVVLAGTVGKGTFMPEGGHKEREFVKYEVTEFEQVVERTANINRLELGGVITAWDRLTRDGSPVYGLKLLHGSTDWGFVVEGRAAVAVQRVATVGRPGIVEARIAAVQINPTDPSGRWRKRLKVTGLKAPGDSTGEDREHSPVAA